MSSVVIVSAVRTAVATARKGLLANTPPECLAACVIRSAVERSVEWSGSWSPAV
jgi:acetyl-CoA acetyltransferase